MGHNSSTYTTNKSSKFKAKRIWVVKGTNLPRANPSGPKKIWVPKKVI